MTNYKRKRRWNTGWRAGLLAGGVLVLVIFLAISVYERFVVERDMAARLNAAQAEKASLKQRQADLTERVHDLSGERGVETEIRRNFDVAREGEQVVVILDDEDDETESDATVEERPATVTSTPWYLFWR